MGEQDLRFHRIKNGLARTAKHFLPTKYFPSFVFVVGAQKAGTTSLHSYLVQHPEIAGATVKELHFFDSESQYSKGANFYLSHFPFFTSAKYAIDATPAYLYNHDAAERIYAFKPEAKIIILLRDPVSRAFSAFNMYKQLLGKSHFKANLLRHGENGKDSFYMPIAEGLTDPEIGAFLDREIAMIHGQENGKEPSLIRRGIYAPQIKRYTDLFGRDKVLIIFSEELQKQTKETVNHVFDFLSLKQLDHMSTQSKHVRPHTADQRAKKRIEEIAGALFAQDKRDLIEGFQLNVPW